MIKLHLGCGDKHFDSWTNVDIQAGPGVDVVADITKNYLEMDRWEKESVDVIYACHVLEHLRKPTETLHLWCGLLKKGGVIRLAVPNFEKCVDWYTATHDLPSIHGLLMGGHKNDYDDHYNVFDFDVLEEMLEIAGFKNVHTYNWRDTDHAKYDDYSQAYLPHMQKEDGTLMSLNVEATK